MAHSSSIHADQRPDEDDLSQHAGDRGDARVGINNAPQLDNCFSGIKALPGNPEQPSTRKMRIRVIGSGLSLLLQVGMKILHYVIRLGRIL